MRTTRWTLGILTVFGLLVFLLMTITSTVQSPTGAAVGFGWSIGYLLIIVWLLSRTPLWPAMEVKPRVMWLLACLGWGGGICIGIVGFTPTATAVSELALRYQWDEATMAFGGAYPEEAIKALGVVFIMLAFRELNRPWHGVLTGMLIGLGFEVVENFGYGALFGLLDPNSDLTGSSSVWLLRVLTGPFLHVFFTGLAGWGVGEALTRAGWGWVRRWAVGLIALSAAFSVHFLWNYGEDDLVVTVTCIAAAVLLYPTIGWLLIGQWRAAAADDTYVSTPRPVTSIAGAIRWGRG